MTEPFRSPISVEQTLLNRIAVFPIAASTAAVRAVVSAAGDIGTDLDAALASLVQQGLLQQSEGIDQEPRLTMSDSLRSEAQAFLKASGAELAVRRAHATYYLALAEEIAATLTGTQQQASFDRLNQDYPNLRAGLDWALDAEETELAVRFANALVLFWSQAAHLTEGRQVLQQVLAHGRDKGGAPPLPALAWAKALHGAGYLAVSARDFDAAQPLLQESLLHYRSLNDNANITDVLKLIGRALADQGDYPQAIMVYEEVRDRNEEAGDQRGVLTALNMLALVNMRRLDYRQSQVMYEQALLLGRQLNLKPMVALFLKNLGYVRGRQENYEGAREAIEESKAIYAGLGMTKGVADCLCHLADVLLQKRDIEQSMELYTQSLVLTKQTGDQENIADCLEGLADVAHAQGHAERAARLLGGSEALREAIGTPVPPSKRAQYSQTAQSVRGSLDAPTLTSMWDEGRSLSVEQLTRYALQDTLT